MDISPGPLLKTINSPSDLKHLDRGQLLELSNELRQYIVDIVSVHGGHLSLDDLNTLKEGDLITKGQIFAHFGRPEENGHWPPHLHFQVIKNIGSFQGDYPGVCRFREKESYLLNCPDPDFIANMNMFIC